MGVIRNLDAARRALARALPDAAAPCERRRFALPAVLALAASLLFLLLPSTPLRLCFPPTFVLACRYHELARHRAVHRSTWLLVCTAVCVPAAIAWTIEQHGGLVQLIHLVLCVALLGLVFHLGATQRRLAGARSRRTRERNGEEGQPRWACGGLLAGMPILFLLGCVGGVLSWRSPIVLAWGLSGLAVLALQLRLHPMFPRLAIAWLGALLGIELLGPLGAGDAQGDELFLAAVMVQFVVPLAAYLEFHPRVRSTFAARPGRRGEARVTPAFEGAAADAPPTRRRGANVPA